MNALSTVLTAPISPSATPAPTTPPAAPAPAPPADPVDRHDITVRQAVEGLAGAAVAAGIEGVGNTASCIANTPRALATSYKALWNTEQIGPVLKTTIACMLPPCALALPVLTALGSVGYGLFSGFGHGVEDGIGKAAEQAVKDVKTFHRDVTPKFLTTLEEAAQRPLPPGETAYEIKVGEGLRGLAAGATCAVIDGAGAGLIAAARTPQGVVKAYKEIWTSEQGPVLKTTESVLVPPAAFLAAPLVTVGGAMYGLVEGVRKGYSEGYGAAVSESVKDVQKFGEMAEKAVRLND